MKPDKENVQKNIAIFKRKSTAKHLAKCEPRAYLDELLKLVPQHHTKIVELDNGLSKFLVEFEHVSWCTLIVIEEARSLQALRDCKNDIEIGNKDVKYMIATNKQDLIVKSTGSNSAISFRNTEITDYLDYLVVLSGFEFADGEITQHDDLRQRFVGLYEQMNEPDGYCEDLDLIYAKFVHVIWAVKQLNNQCDKNLHRYLIREAMYYIDGFGLTLVPTIEVCGKPEDKRSRNLPDELKCLPYLDCALHDVCTTIPYLNSPATQLVLGLVGCKWSLAVDLPYLIRLVEEMVGQEITIESNNGQHVEDTKSIFFTKSRTKNLILKPQLVAMMKPKAGQLSLFEQ